MIDSPAAWFDDARFGLFMHWGLYSLLGHTDAEWVLFKSKLDRTEYNRLTRQFRADRWNPDELAALAKAAGMRYMVLTTRHHDGFCLFDTKTTDFNAMHAAVGRDLVAEYAAACRRAGLRLGFYYSIMSWQHDAVNTGPTADPAGWEAMVAETHAQLRELMTNYGKVDMLWYDGACVPGIQDAGIIARFWRSRELNAMIRKLQPGILINDRSGLPEDLATPEQHVEPPAPGRRWEACMTINGSWGYNIHDRAFKSPTEILRNLVRCARFGGNLLLNIGPRGDGSVQPECVDSLSAVGRWLATHGEAIYGSERTPWTEADHVAGPTTQRGRTVYVHLFDRPDTCVIDGVGTVTAARLLGSGVTPTVRTDAAGRVAVDIPATPDMPAVLALELAAAPTAAASVLGGGDQLRQAAPGAPILGDVPSRYEAPPAPVLTDAALAACLVGPWRPGDAAAWCPGWRDRQVFAPEGAGELTVDVPVAGRYRLALGMVATDAAGIRVCLDGAELPAPNLPHPGFPDTCTFADLRLAAGAHTLTVAGNFGLYGLRLSPVWRAFPSECWHAIGPFPTGFGPQEPVSEVAAALARVFPPETEFDPAAVYPGVDGQTVQWTTSPERGGEHSDVGVNFPYRCGTDFSGVCYARTVVVSPEERAATIMLGCDWWANLWVNGEPIRSERDPGACAADGAQFTTWKPQPAHVRLRAGDNVLLVKCHPGSRANWFSCRISDPGDLTVA